MPLIQPSSSDPILSSANTVSSATSDIVGLKKQTIKESNHEKQLKQPDNSPSLSKPLPQLMQEVIEAMEKEEARLRQEEYAIKRYNDTQLDKPLPRIAPQPSPPPKDNLVTPAPLERLSLEEDYPNRTVNPEDILSKEYRERTNAAAYQWYFDEYSGIYRHNIPIFANSASPSPNLKCGDSLPNIKHINKLLSRSSSTFLPDGTSPLTSRFLRRGYSTSTLASSPQTVSGQDMATEDEWPTPTTIEEVHKLRKKARATKDRRKQLDLCRTLMHTVCRSETVHVTESPIPGTPPVNTRYHQQELRKKNKKDLMLDEVLVIEAQKILKRLAIGGGGIGLGTDGDAQFLLANCYGVGGLGLPLDRERAFSLYIHASKQNHLESTYRAGVCCELGIGTRKDYSRAMMYYRKAATQLHVASMYKLAVILLRGFCGQTINVREALLWLQRAAPLATAQHPHALYLLAMFHLSEEFVNSSTVVDSTYGLELLHESAQLNYTPSQVKLGELYEQGGVVEVDDALSIYWYTRAAEQGNADAALALSSWYLTGSSGILPQSDQEAYLWARKAASCQTSNRWTLAKAHFLVGMYVEKGIGTGETSTEDANVWFRRSAALGHRSAIEMLEKSNEFTSYNNYSSEVSVESE